MEKKFSVKKYLLFLAVAACACLLAFFILDEIHKKENGEQLEQLLSEMTYQSGALGEEIKVLEEFAPALECMKHSDQARYYGVLTKCYVLRGDVDHALLKFVDTEIHAEIGKAYDVVAWLYVDIAQVYLELDAPDVALECINTALEYGKEQPMEEFFYEYAYLIRAQMEARAGRLENAKMAYKQSMQYEQAEDKKEYYSMQQRRNLVMASIMMQSGDFPQTEAYLHKLESYIQSMESLPTDSMWFSVIYYPYLTLQMKYNMYQGNYETAAQYMDETFATGIIYGQVSSLMNGLNEILSLIDTLDENELPKEVRAKMDANMQRLVMEYPVVFQNKNNITATYIFNSNMITIAVYVQQNETEQLYKMIIEGVAAVVLIIVGLIYLMKRIEHKGRVDGLTGAYIRRYFDEVYENLKNGTTEFGVIMYDIDFFKQINDGFGHDAGDVVLRDTTSMVMGMLDHSSQLFRYGGDEFCIICRKMTLEEMAVLAENIRSYVEQMQWHEGMNVSFSMGVAVASQSPDRDVMAKVDEKLYASKEAGRNCVSW